MNRTIKFRAWDKEKKEMLKSNDDGTCKVSPEVYDSAFIFIGLNGEVMKYERERTRGATFFDAGIQGQHEIDGTNGNFILMQFTGLKDKNGKEIYEGDILKLKSGKIYEVGEPLHFGHFIFTLEQNGTEFGEFDERGEVIGNVFENPNLLKK